jgi:hypothetical protein
MVRSGSGSFSRGIFVILTILAAGLLLVPAARADIVGSPANAGTTNAGDYGFKNGAGWTANLNAQGDAPLFNGPGLQITDDTASGNESNTAFYLSPQIVTGPWTASFIYYCTGNQAGGGVTFCIQNDPAGSFAGINSGVGPLGYQGINNSVALALNVSSQSNPKAGTGAATGETDVLFSSGAEGLEMLPGTMYTNDPTVTGNPPFSIASGDPIEVVLTYSPSTTTLTETLTDMTTGGTATYTYTVDVALIVGADIRNVQTPFLGTAFVGFTGGTGTTTSTQTISNFTFVENP